jgi:hypothetical protein
MWINDKKNWLHFGIGLKRTHYHLMNGASPYWAHHILGWKWQNFIVPKLMPSSILMMKIIINWMSRYVSPKFSSIPKGENLVTPMVQKIKLGWASSANKSFGGDAHPRPTTLSNHLFYWEIFSNYYCRWWFVLAIFFIREFDPSILVVP